MKDLVSGVIALLGLCLVMVGLALILSGRNDSALSCDTSDSVYMGGTAVIDSTYDYHSADGDLWVSDSVRVYPPEEAPHE